MAFRRQQFAQAGHFVDQRVLQMVFQQVAKSVRAGHALGAHSLGLIEDGQPDIATAEHFAEQFFQAGVAVVQVAEQLGEAVRPGHFAFQGIQQILYRRLVQGLGIFRGGHARAEGGLQRQCLGEHGAQAVEGADLQARGVGKQLPTISLIGLQCVAGELPGLQCMGFLRLGAAPRRQGAEDTRAHFRRRFTGKGDGENGFRLGDPRQQGEHALGQQLGFTAARRGLADKGAGGVEGALALGAVGGVTNIGLAHAPSSSSAKRSVRPTRMRQRLCSSQNWQVVTLCLGSTRASPRIKSWARRSRVSRQ